ncbi:flagellar filament capping protein FliD [Massilia sp. PAMC28688]|uniref:flagellar filament capping protein FliD n=1 Tax=Massilia sp. PAMC28688 TaxID=2861283 RepID=UPI001C62B775|nr:flagellar filament capping protein FliD [Massilia sp. PAMC28688]QYF92037.1 flagellar filament capping protein FliD [Massilia sp. PAMC28688]
MGLSSAGLGSNLPVDSIVSQLMSIEQRPLNALDKKVSTFQAKLSALGTLKGAMSTFQTAVKGLADMRKFMGMTAAMGDATVASASAGPGAAAGTYSLEISKLAQAQKLASSGQVSTSAAIGAGTITIDLGTVTGGTLDAATGKYTGAAFTSSGAGAKSVTIDPANTSLSGIRDAINKAGIGVTASIVNDGSATPNRLLLTQTATGQASSMKISVDGDAALQSLLNHDPAGVQNFQQTVAAQNAEFKLDGLAISTASNNASGVIEGVTLNLAKTNVGTPTSLTVGRDTTAVTESVNKFVTAYNAINKTLKDLTAYNEATKTGAILNGDATARSIQTELRGLLTSPVENGSSAFSVLSEIGVTVKAGIMAVDEAKLKKTIETNFDDIATLFASVGKPTDSLVSFKGATDKTTAGSYAVTITQLATMGRSTGSTLAGLTIDASNKTIEVLLDGKTASVTLGEGTYADADALAKEVQSRINGTALFSGAGSAVTVTQDAGKMVITSNRYGAASGVSITGDAGGANLMGAGATSTAGVDIAGTIGGLAATGAGRTLTAGPGAAEGLSLTAEGLGARGSINYSQGYAYQFNKFTEKLLGTEGPLTLRTDGINASIKQLAENRLRIVDRLGDVEKRYRTQYTALDVTISRMNSTSAYLAQQLAQLSNL